MKKLILAFTFMVTLTVQSQYLIDDKLYCDYELNGEQSQGVYYEDMVDDFNNSCAIDAGFIEGEN